jgi:hypothetical protein
MLGLYFAVAPLGCVAEPPPGGPSVAIAVAPLDLPGVTNASWRLTVSTASDTVWTRDVTSRAFGDGAGSLSYVGPCDADAGANTVTVELLGLFRGAAGDVPVDPASYHNPGPLARTVTCLANSDVAVAFEVTLARAATQGFFDVAVTFDDIFCSAKLDCQQESGAPITLLSDSTGVRRPTVILGFACTADTAAQDTTLYLNAISLACANSNTATIDPAGGPGRLSDGAGITQSDVTPVLFGAAVYRGQEDLGGVGKLYWNLALGLELGTAGAESCTLTTRGTAASGALVNSATAAGSTYPYITWSVPLTSAAGALTCTQHPVGGDNGVAIAYADPGAPVSFAFSYANATAVQTTSEVIGARTEADPGRWSDGSSAASCDDYRHPSGAYAYTGATGDGVYRVDPGGLGAYLVYCDMTTEGGGWTLVMRTLSSTAYPDDASAWYTGTPSVAAASALSPTGEGVSLAYSTVVGTQLMFKTHAEAAGYWARFVMPTAGSLLDLVGTTNISAANNGYKATLTTAATGSNAHACWAQDWRVRWRNYASGDNYPDSSLFAPSELTASYRPCGGHTSYASGIGVRTDTSNGWVGYGGSWEGGASEVPGNPALTGGSVSLWVGGPVSPITLVGARTEADPGRWSNGSFAASCYDYRHPTGAYVYGGAAAGDGVYRVDPDGLGAYLVYCDMTTEGGGWTLVMRTTDDAAYPDDASAWYTGSPSLAATTALTPAGEGLSLAYGNLAGSEVLFKTHAEAAGYWARFAMSSPGSLLELVGTTNISAATDGYKDTLTTVATGSNALACWGQDWRVRWRNYASGDVYPDSALFAPATLTSSYRPCGGNTHWATGVAVRTDTSNGWTGYGGSWEGSSTDPNGNSALTGGTLSLWIGGP